MSVKVNLCVCMIEAHIGLLGGSGGMSPRFCIHSETTLVYFFYQPGACEVRARLVLRLLYVPMSVCVCVCPQLSCVHCAKLHHCITKPL